MSRRLILTSFALLLMAFVAVAQDDAEVFLRAAGNASNLYRGRKALDYKFPYNGTFFWESPVYHPGRVCYNSKVYLCDAMNIDASQQELLVKDRSGIISVMLNRDHVKWFTLGGRKYINGQLVLDNPDFPEGFFEVLYEGRVLALKQVIKTLDKTNTPEMVDTGTPGVAILANVFEVFKQKVSCYYVDEDGSFERITRRKEIYKIYRQHRRELRAAIAREEPDEIVLPLEEVVRIVVEIGEGLR